jgi:hypothetical protein
VIVARVVSCVFAVLAVLAAFGWLHDQDVSHAVGFVAAALLAFVLSTIPIGRVP